jgi:hypothetical protein
MWVNGRPRYLAGSPRAVNRYGLAGGIDFGTFGPVAYVHGTMI